MNFMVKIQHNTLENDFNTKNVENVRCFVKLL